MFGVVKAGRKNGTKAVPLRRMVTMLNGYDCFKECYKLHAYLVGDAQSEIFSKEPVLPDASWYGSEIDRCPGA